MAADRDNTGKFVKGCKTGGARAGSGQKPLIQRDLIDKAVTPEQWVEIYSAMRDSAIAGDVRAAAFLDERRFGKPKELVDEGAAPVVPHTTVFHAPAPVPDDEDE